MLSSRVGSTPRGDKVTGTGPTTATSRARRGRLAVLPACLILAPFAFSPPWPGTHGSEPAPAPAVALEYCGAGEAAPAERAGKLGGIAAPEPLTSQRLQCLLEWSRVHGGAGFIYAWSPHMPLSVKGLPEAASIAAAMRLAFVPAMDPYADPGLIERLLEAGTVQVADTSPVTAGLLLEQGLLHHYPSLVVFAHGRIHAPCWPGYHRPSVLERYLTNRLR